jgi:hypothetical protein
MILLLKKRSEGMKLLSLIAVGLVVALSGGAQITTDEKQQPSPAQKEKATTEESVKANEGREVTKSVQPKESERVRTSAQGNATKQEGAKVTEKVGAKEREGARVQEKSGSVSRSTTVFRNGRETKEQLTLHRTTRERTDVHFSIGTHDRAWWLATYTIVVMDSCPYYLADDGCWYPAYGFDPSCTFPEGIVYCQ